MVKSYRKNKILFILIFLLLSFKVSAAPKLVIVCDKGKVQHNNILDLLKKKLNTTFNIRSFFAEYENINIIKESIITYAPEYQIFLGRYASELALSSKVPTIVSLAYNLDQKIAENSNIKWFIPFPSPEYSFSIIDRILKYPSMAALIYNPESNSSLADKFINSEAEKLFMVEYQLEKSEKAVEKFEAVKNRVQLFFSIPDNIVFNRQSFAHLKRFAVINKKPVVGFNKKFLKRGAFISFYLSDMQIVEGLINLLIKLKEEPESVDKITLPAVGTYSLNSSMLEILKIKVSDEIKSQAVTLE